jgi:hypothetical protein
MRSRPSCSNLKRFCLEGIALAALTCGLSGCGTATFIIQQYDGSPLAAEQVAVLRLNGSDPVRLEALDGEPLGYELHDRASRVHIEMLPGEHELALAEAPELPAKRRRFRAEAGKVYRPLLVRTPTAGAVIPGVTAWVVGIYEVDANSDEIVREISQGPVHVGTSTLTPVPSAPSTTATGTAQTVPSPPAIPAPPPPAPLPPTAATVEPQPSSPATTQVTPIAPGSTAR